MPPSPRFVNVGSLSSNIDTTGEEISAGLEGFASNFFNQKRLGQQESQFGRSLEEQKRRFDEQSAINRLAVQLSDKQRQNQLDLINTNRVSQGQEPINDIGTKALNTITDTQTRANQQRVEQEQQSQAANRFLQLFEENKRVAQNPQVGINQRTDAPGSAERQQGPTQLSAQGLRDIVNQTRQEFLSPSVKGNAAAFQSPQVQNLFSRIQGTITPQRTFEQAFQTRAGQEAAMQLFGTTNPQNLSTSEKEFMRVAGPRLQQMSPEQRAQAFSDFKFNNAKDRREFATKIRDKFEASPDVTQFNKLSSAFSKIKTINLKGDTVTDPKTGKKTVTRVISDSTLNVLFNKMIDPDSAVLPAEFARTEELLSTWNKIQATGAKILGKGGLKINDADRVAIVKMARNFEEELFLRTAQRAQDQIDLAERNGASGKDVVTDSALLQRIKSPRVQRILALRANIRRKTGELQ